jgi:hypothetical protein
MASVQVRTGIREEYPVLRNYAYPGIKLGNIEKTGKSKDGYKATGGKLNRKHMEYECGTL